MDEENSISFAAWMSEADESLRRRFGIGIREASTEQLEVAWRLGETPDLFADWFGDKYALQNLGEFR